MSENNSTGLFRPAVASPRHVERDTIYIVDSHCHLDLIEKQGLNIEEVLQNCAKNDVRLLQTICTRISKIDEILKFSNKYENVFASIGNHPCNVVEEPEIKADEIIRIAANNNKIIGIGETGLDYFHQPFDKIKQKQSFLEHIKASQMNDLPVIIHSRDSDLDMMEILESEQKNKNFPALLHCFSSSEDLARKALDLGIYISISGIVTFKNALDLQNIVKFLPLDMLLVETDSPYLAPVPNRGKTNQPAYTRHVVEFIAQLKGLKTEEVANQTSENFFNIFKKAKRV